MVPSRRRRCASRLATGLVTVALVVGPFATTGADPAVAASPARAQSVEPPFGASLSARMATLFHDIADDSASQGQRLFFPESAYVAMKVGRIPDPASDYVQRLVAFFRLDVAAYHSAIFAHGPVTFLGVNADAAYATWIRPGWCENSIGYWHVPGVRLVYRQGRQVRSVGVASLISWRGVWYVVHLGPNPRPLNVGTVDQPAAGRGVPGPAGGC
jgi:hypothetical protein